MLALDSSFTIGIALAPCSAWNTCSELIMGEIPAPFPRIKFVLSEGGIGWVPHALERADRTWERHHHWAGLDYIPPNEAFQRNIWVCFIDEQTLRRSSPPLRDRQDHVRVRLPAC
jgi:hypothetical protein